MKSFQFLSLVVFVSAVVGCGNKETIYFGKFSKYELRKGEVNHYPVPKEKVDEYEACCWMEGQSIYLNRALTYPEKYRVFIGAGELIHSSEFATALENDALYTVLEQKEVLSNGVKLDVYLVKRDDWYLTRIGFDEAKGGLFLLCDHVFSNEADARQFYTDVDPEFTGHVDLPK
jgi:hypothetical protein